MITCLSLLQLITMIIYAKLYVFMGINDKLCRLQKFSQVCKDTKYLDLPKKNDQYISKCYGLTSVIVRRALCVNTFFSRTVGPILTKFGL